MSFIFAAIVMFAGLRGCRVPGEGSPDCLTEMPRVKHDSPTMAQWGLAEYGEACHEPCSRGREKSWTKRHRGSVHGGGQESTHTHQWGYRKGYHDELGWKEKESKYTSYLCTLDPSLCALHITSPLIQKM